MSFVEDQKKVEGDCNFTMTQFDTQDPCEVVWDHVPITDVDHIKLTPRGGTPLLDAVVRGVAYLDDKLGTSKPDHVLCMIITDGHENSSREVKNVSQVKELIASREKQGWVFMFLGADLDNTNDARDMGVAGVHTVSAGPGGQNVNKLYRNVSDKLGGTRAMGMESEKTNAGVFSVDSDTVAAQYNFTDEEREDMVEKKE